MSSFNNLQNLCIARTVRQEMRKDPNIGAMADSLLIAASDDRLFLVGQVRFPKDKLRILAIAKFIVGDNAVFENIVAKEADPPTSGTVDEQRQRAEDVFPKLNDRASRTRLSARITIRE